MSAASGFSPAACPDSAAGPDPVNAAADHGSSADAKTIATVGIIGAGTMGGGIATALAAHDRSVLLFDTAPDRAPAAIAAAAAFYARAVEKGRLTEEQAAMARHRLTAVDRLADLAPADLVIEAVFEDETIKTGLLAELSGLLSAEAIIASNTSCLRIDGLAAAVRAPDRFLGLHFFSPAAVNPLVEVVEGAATDAGIADLAHAFCLAIGKQPLRCRDAHGFAVNRFFCPYTNEAVRLLDAGLADPAAIDRAAAQALGAALGPFAVMNIVKPRINLDAIRNLAPLGAFYAPAAGMVAQGEADRPWPIAGAAPPDETVLQPLVDRLRAAVFLAVLELLDEAIAAAADIDMGARLALRFTRPPAALMDELGRPAVERLVAPLAERYGRPVPRSLGRIGRLTG